MSGMLGRIKLFSVFLFAFLAACGQEATAQPVETAASTMIPPSPVPTPTFASLNFVPTPFPTEPIFPVITPDPVEVERWNEYEEALAATFFRSYYAPEEVVCEWEILGRSDREMYVWADCWTTYAAGFSAASIPAVIRVGEDGSLQGAEIPGGGGAYAADIRQLFPPDVQERIFNHAINSQGWGDRLRWRRAHPDDPPLLVLPFLPPQPTPTTFRVIKPDPVQVERWEEYQSALAQRFSYLPAEQPLCEWEILGRSREVNEVYVWAICGATNGSILSEDIAVLYIAEDGTVHTGIGSAIESPSKLSPDARHRYFTGLIRFQELVDHLRWRQSHPEEPPLIILSATPAP